MPTKRQKAIRCKMQDKNNNKKKFIIIALAVLMVLIVPVYLLFDGSSGKKIKDELTGNSSVKRDEGESGKATQVIDSIPMALTRAKLQILSLDNKDLVKVIIEKAEKDGKEIMHKYEWSINNEPAGTGGDSISGFKRGDRIAVKITPFSDENLGQARILTVEIQNTTPKISEGKKLKNDGKEFSYQIVASDPDGDTLIYTLVDALPGMSIDAATGILNWQFKEGDYGNKQSIKVRISDGKGGEIIYPLEVTLEKPNERPIPKK